MKRTRVGARFGIFVVLAIMTTNVHYGQRVHVRCAICGHERKAFLAPLRHKTPVHHRGCSKPHPVRRVPAPRVA